MVALFGIASTVIAFASFGIVSGAPKLGTGSPDELAEWFSDHTGAVLVSSVIGAVGIALSVAFLFGVGRLLRDAEGGRSVLADVGAASGVFIFAIVAVGLVAQQAAALLAGSDAGASSGQLRLGSATLLASFAVSAAPTIVLAVCYAVVIGRTNALPDWVAWTLLIVGAVHVGALVSVARTGVMAPEGLFAVGAPLLYELWQLAAGVALLRQAPAT